MNENELIRALDSGQLAGAVLDVCETEPLPATSPLWTHESVTLTPHIAGPTQIAQSAEQIASSIEQLERGEKPVGLVNRQAGY